MALSPPCRADHTRVKPGPLTNFGDWAHPPVRLRAESPIWRSRRFRPPPPVRLRAEPWSHRLPLQGGVLEASTRLPVELYHSPLEGESQKPSRMAKADAVGGKARLRIVRQGGSYQSKTTDLSGELKRRFGLIGAGERGRAAPGQGRAGRPRSRVGLLPSLWLLRGPRPAGRMES